MSYLETSFEIPSAAIRRRGVWYQAMYNLAAHQAHLSLQRRGVSPVLQRAAPSFVGDALETAALLLATAAHTLDELQHVSVRRRFWERNRPLPEERLARFLSTSMEPAAAILVAGVIGEGDGEASVDVSSRAKLVETMREIARSGHAPQGTGDALVAFALERPRLSYRVHYNVACYLSGTLREHDNADVALHALARALGGAPTSERRSLAAWAPKDPSLSELRARRPDDFEQLLRFYVVAVPRSRRR